MEERTKSRPEEKSSDSVGGHLVKTVGHGRRSLEEFIDILRSEGIQGIVDVRSIPRSRHNSQFNAETLAAVLDPFGIDYLHMASLGGFRRPRKDSPNGAWRNASFRGFADYMQTEEFSTALGEFEKLSLLKTTALMCAETLPWRCHRSLIADALTVKGQHVMEILGKGHHQLHKLTPWALVEGERVLYPLRESPGSPCPLPKKSV